jgi:HAD superfamily hydrolase (TIGR01509 family)
MYNFAVIFDMDGVLIDSNPYHKTAIEVFLEKHHFKFTEDELKQKVWGRMNREWLRAVFGEEMSVTEINQHGEDKEFIYRQLFAKDIKEVKGLTSFLKILKANQVPCAVGTSAPRSNVDFTFEHLQIADFFEIVLDESHVNLGKPNPEIYLKVADYLGFPPQRCIVIEDSLAGTTAGKAAGAKVIGVTTTHSPEELRYTSDLIIDDFSNLSIDDLVKLTN